MPQDNPAVESAQFSVTCPQCGAAVPTTVGEHRSSLPCPKCAAGIDLTTDEVKHARQAAAAEVTIEEGMKK